MSSREECICSIALTQVPGIGHIWAKKLVDGIGSAADVFRFRQELPERLPGVNNRVVEALDCPQALVRAGEEYEFAEKNHIQCLTLADERYPSRLRECDDAPIHPRKPAAEGKGSCGGLRAGGGLGHPRR